MKKFSKLSCLIIGCGSIGERHVHNLKKLGVNNIAVYDTSKKKVNYLSNKYKTKKFYQLESTESFKPNFSIICTYPSSHIDLTNFCLDLNSHVFVEKPLSSNLRNVRKTLLKAKKRKLKISVGYNLRFDKGINVLKNNIEKQKIGKPLSIFCQYGQHIKYWHPGTDYTQHYILKKGGGIILDDSHEYDYLRWILNDEPTHVYCQTKRTSNFRTQTESTALINLKFRKGTIVTIMMDYLRPSYLRNCYILGENGDITWTFTPNFSSSKLYYSKAISKVIINNNARKTKIETFSITANSTYIDEMKNFLQSILQNKKPTSDGFDAILTLKIGLAALRSAKLNKVIRI